MLCVPGQQMSLTGSDAGALEPHGAWLLTLPGHDEDTCEPEPPLTSHPPAALLFTHILPSSQLCPHEGLGRGVTRGKMYLVATVPRVGRELFKGFVVSAGRSKVRVATSRESGACLEGPPRVLCAQGACWWLTQGRSVLCSLDFWAPWPTPKPRWLSGESGSLRPFPTPLPHVPELASDFMPAGPSCSEDVDCKAPERGHCVQLAVHGLMTFHSDQPHRLTYS